MAEENHLPSCVSASNAATAAISSIGTRARTGHGEGLGEQSTASSLVEAVQLCGRSILLPSGLMMVAAMCGGEDGDDPLACYQCPAFHHYHHHWSHGKALLLLPQQQQQASNAPTPFVPAHFSHPPPPPYPFPHTDPTPPHPKSNHG